jgi:hypothetical protein
MVFVCIWYIGVVSIVSQYMVYMVYNCVYYCDTMCLLLYVYILTSDRGTAYHTSLLCASYCSLRGVCVIFIVYIGVVSGVC